MSSSQIPRNRRAAGGRFALALLLIAGCGRSETEIDRIYQWQGDPTPANVERIRDRLEAQDRDVRATALFTLVSLRVPDAADLAVAGIEDDDAFVRATAAKLLGDLEAGSATGLLVEHLLGDPNPTVRQRCAEALTVIGGAEAEQGLVRALEDPLHNVRKAAVEGVAELNADLGFDGLARIASSDPLWEIRAEAARALGRTTRPEAEAVLERMLEDDNENVRSAAANALRHLGAGGNAPQ